MFTVALCAQVSMRCAPPTLFVQGIAAVLPFMRRQVTDISRSDLVIFLKEGNPLYTSLSPPTAAKFGELGKYVCMCADTNVAS